MNDEQAWKYFERLADPDLRADQRVRMEQEIAADPLLSARFEAFQAMCSWSQIEPVAASNEGRVRLMEMLQKDREEELVAVSLGKLFPVFMGGAVAAALLLGFMNVQLFGDLAGGTWEALFGMPAETIETVIASQL